MKRLFLLVKHQLKKVREKIPSGNRFILYRTPFLFLLLGFLVTMTSFQNCGGGFNFIKELEGHSSLTLNSSELSNSGNNQNHTGSIIGFIDAVRPSGNSVIVTGWACQEMQRDPIAIHAFVGGPSGVGTLLGGYLANQSREAGVQDACRSGTSAHGFMFRIPNASQYSHHQKIHIHGIHSSGESSNHIEIGNSGIFNASSKLNPPQVQIEFNNQTFRGFPTTIRVTSGSEESLSISTLKISWDPVDRAQTYSIWKTNRNGSRRQIMTRQNRTTLSVNLTNDDLDHTFFEFDVVAETTDSSLNESSGLKRFYIENLNSGFCLIGDGLTEVRCERSGTLRQGDRAQRGDICTVIDAPGNRDLEDKRYRCVSNDHRVWEPLP
jgi:hypothetical protein